MVKKAKSLGRKIGVLENFLSFGRLLEYFGVFSERAEEVDRLIYMYVL